METKRDAEQNRHLTPRSDKGMGTYREEREKGKRFT